MWFNFQNGASLNSRKNLGETALHEAAKQGHMQIVQLLVEKGAQIDLEDEHYRWSAKEQNFNA